MLLKYTIVRGTSLLVLLSVVSFVLVFSPSSVLKYLESFVIPAIICCLFLFGCNICFSVIYPLWEASPLLADYITNPACPLEAFQRMRIHYDDDGNVRLQPQPSTVVELGSGVGLASW